VAIICQFCQIVAFGGIWQIVGIILPNSVNSVLIVAFGQFPNSGGSVSIVAIICQSCQFVAFGAICGNHLPILPNCGIRWHLANCGHHSAKFCQFGANCGIRPVPQFGRFGVDCGNHLPILPNCGIRCSRRGTQPAGFTVDGFSRFSRIHQFTRFLQIPAPEQSQLFRNFRAATGTRKQSEHQPQLPAERAR
jgi:hypothetical protein